MFLFFGGLGLLFRLTDSLFVELVCTQSEEDVDEMSRFRTCNGNASEACLWAPALWIKVVTRDSSRLNNAWRG
ncbi:unnamed protein product [Trichobilharzia regenti]|nr:unnamed protein product [Trichobilharzia regenti]